MATPKLSITKTGLETIAVDAVVIGTIAGTDGIALAPGAEAIDAAFGGRLTGILTELGAKGAAGEAVKLATLGTITAPVVLAAGLGAVEDTPSAEQVRRASGVAARALAGTRKAASTLSTVDTHAAVEGTILGAYQPSVKPNGEALGSVAFAAQGGTGQRAELRTATAIAEAVCQARDLINTPPNELYPQSFAVRAKQLGEDAGMTVEVLDEKALRRKGFGGILGVGDGSSRPPRLVRMRYRPNKPKAKVAVVGKGITFDTGGISLKPPAKMDDMTSDMSGAAAAVAVAALAARLKLPIEVTATVPMAENMPSGTAYRPGDVLTMYGGKTVEVLNTDAEGRLVLADAIVRACEDKPDYLIEAATLTGAQLTALGTRTSGVMGSPEFRDRVAEQGREVGEAAWAMPLPEELRADLDSNLADLTNVSNGAKVAGMLLAGVFLGEFVAEGVDWAHIDVAGPAYNTGSPWGYTGKGGTGVPVRTMAAVLTDIAEHG
ncbi:leucyl aminopeptidase [Sciscionella sediminilitoris]|uniref:leucyl aminopeptidase n=1 Tax=Sciscionella sediminilitoris TaxID=1445613 RepID=UPI0004DF93B4|nr:leucyl aminopeptidase [Sciscionella sp. SE31]